LTRRLYESISNADPTLFERHLSRSPNCVVIGTAPGEWWDDCATAFEAIRAQMEAVGDDVDLQPGDLRAYREGNVGWVADRPTFSLGAAMVECRHTSVFVHAEGEWHIVQNHFSIAVLNEDVFGSSALSS